MKSNFRAATGFILLEFLVVIVVIAALWSLTLSRAKAKVQRMACINNLRPSSLGARMYSHDADDDAPSPGPAAGPHLAQHE